jgi:hypothetical protein
MKMTLPDFKVDPWHTHKWVARQIEIDGRNQLLLSCTQCERDFIDECHSKERCAAHLSIFRVDCLNDQVTERWCREICPGKRLKSDDAERLKTLPRRNTGAKPTVRERFGSGRGI